MRKNRSGIVIVSNPLNHEGGVVAFCKILMQNFSSPHFVLSYHVVGSRMELFHSPILKRILYPFYYFYDILKLTIFLLRYQNFRIVQLNPSLIPIPLIRDGIILFIIRIFRCKSLVIFHGWNYEFLDYLNNHKWSKWLFNTIFRRSSMTLVLSSRFKYDLVALGWDPSLIGITTTMFEAESILPVANRSSQRMRFIFLGRISRLKGIDELIEAARMLSASGYDFEFMMVGHGDSKGILAEYSKRVESYGIKDHFVFAGPLFGKDKYQAYAESDVYVFPSWTEGCPTSVLEALGSGLFVISTDVGALRDIICEGKNGRIVRCKDPYDLVEKLAWACEHIAEIRMCREHIQTDACNRFEAGIIVDQFKNIYSHFVGGRKMNET